MPQAEKLLISKQWGAGRRPWFYSGLYAPTECVTLANLLNPLGLSLSYIKNRGVRRCSEVIITVKDKVCLEVRSYHFSDLDGILSPS